MASTSAGLQSDFFFGWDLLFKTIEGTINKKSDVLIALAHFIIVKHSKFRCIGIGEDKTLSEDEIGSELLPDGWTDGATLYALRYVQNHKLYLMLGHRTENCLIINLLNVETKKVTNIALVPEELVHGTKGPIEQLLPNVSLLVDRFRRELIEPVFTGSTKETTTQTNPPQNDPPQQFPGRSNDPLRITDPLRVGEPMRPRGQFVPGIDPLPFGFPDVGRGDLDPLGRGGPGNLFNLPPHPNFNAGVQPRFDPYGPPDRNVRPNPNPDHMQPPNYGGHDYYM